MSLQDFSGQYDPSKELCFDGNEFLKDSFSIDIFLREHRSASLEVMRDDLGTFLKTLRLSMIELINKDYEDFVNLSKDLVGLNHGIQDIQKPIETLGGKVMQVKTDLVETIKGICDCMEQQRQIRDTKRCLSHLSQVITSVAKLKSILMEDEIECKKNLTLDLVERAAMEANHLHYSQSKCENLISESLKKDSDSVQMNLISILSNMFLECLCEKHVDGLYRCLRIFTSLGKVDHLHELVRTDVISPALYGIISKIPQDAAMKQHKNPNYLKSVYADVMLFVDMQLKELLHLTTPNNNKAIKGYNFIAYSLWPELEKKLELDFRTMFRHGNSNECHERYTESVKLIEKLEIACGDLRKVKELRKHPQYQQFLHKWNLNVYYKIRFQEIAGRLEIILGETDFLHTMNGSNNEFLLKSTSITFKCLERCWNESVYIREIGHLFWKLSLQVISRYSIWIKEILEKVNKVKRGRDESSPSPGTTTTTTTATTAGPTAQQPEDDINVRLNFLVCLYSDTNKLLKEGSSFIEDKQKQLTKDPVMSNELKESCSEAFKKLCQCLPEITSSIVKLIVGQSIGPLGSVVNIPRRYLDREKERPNRPSEYVTQVLSLPQQFALNLKESIEEDVLKSWMSQIIIEISQRFYNDVGKVLENDKTLKETLRRLHKNKYSRGDDTKIQQQLVIDVQAFREGASRIVDITNIEQLNQLVDLVESANEHTDKQ